MTWLCMFLGMHSMIVPYLPYKHFFRLGKQQPHVMNARWPLQDVFKQLEPSKGFLRMVWFFFGYYMLTNSRNSALSRSTSCLFINVASCCYQCKSSAKSEPAFMLRSWWGRHWGVSKSEPFPSLSHNIGSSTINKKTKHSVEPPILLLETENIYLMFDSTMDNTLNEDIIVFWTSFIWWSGDVLAFC